jgi:hypothetical protein
MEKQHAMPESLCEDRALFSFQIAAATCAPLDDTGPSLDGSRSPGVGFSWWRREISGGKA